MKILYVITGLAQGGAERVVCDLADEMYSRGHDIKIVYLTGDLLTKPFHQEIEIIKLNLNNIFSLLIAYFVLSKIIKKYNPDVVHAHMIHANLFTRLVRIITPIKKLICTAHSQNEGGVMRMALYRITHSLSNITTNVSQFATDVYIKKKAAPKNGIITMYNGIRFDTFYYNNMASSKIRNEFNINATDKILLAVGRLEHAKNYPNLLKAIKIIKENHNICFKLLIAGEGQLRSNIENLIQDLKLEAEVILLGRRNDIPTLMSACDVFVLSSDYEGLPTVLIEALGCQAQAVSTNVSGAKEIISEYGTIIKLDDPRMLSDAIFAALQIKEKNVQGSLYVREKFDINIIASQWLDLY